MLTPHPPEIATGFRFIDKIEHFAAFLVLAVLFSVGIDRRRFSKIGAIVLMVAILVVYGAAIELIQPYTGRSADISDFFADVAGIAAGCIISLFFL